MHLDLRVETISLDLRYRERTSQHSGISFVYLLSYLLIFQAVSQHMAIGFLCLIFGGFLVINPVVGLFPY